jgi:HSP20 family protein
MEPRDLAPWQANRTPAHGISPFDTTLDSLHREFYRMFESFWRGMGPQPFASSIWGFNSAVPAIDQSEDEAAYHVAVELPGIEKKDVEISLADNVLTIRGERELDKEEKEQSYYLRERAHGSFRRSLSFPVQIDENKVKAAFADGVLSITLLKTKEAQKKAKTIAITSK